MKSNFVVFGIIYIFMGIITGFLAFILMHIDFFRKHENILFFVVLFILFVFGFIFLLLYKRFSKR